MHRTSHTACLPGRSPPQPHPHPLKSTARGKMPEASSSLIALTLPEAAASSSASSGSDGPCREGRKVRVAQLHRCTVSASGAVGGCGAVAASEGGGGWVQLCSDGKPTAEQAGACNAQHGCSSSLAEPRLVSSDPRHRDCRTTAIPISPSLQGGQARPWSPAKASCRAPRGAAGSPHEA